MIDPVTRVIIMVVKIERNSSCMPVLKLRPVLYCRIKEKELPTAILTSSEIDIRRKRMTKFVCGEVTEPKRIDMEHRPDFMTELPQPQRKTED